MEKFDAIENKSSYFVHEKWEKEMPMTKLNIHANMLLESYC